MSWPTASRIIRGRACVFSEVLIWYLVARGQSGQRCCGSGVNWLVGNRCRSSGSRKTALTRSPSRQFIPSAWSTLVPPTLKGFRKIHRRLWETIMAGSIGTPPEAGQPTTTSPVASLLTRLDIKVRPHDMSHYHGSRNEQLDASQRRDLAQSELFAGFFDRLKAAAKPAGTTLFAHTTVVFGSNIRTGHELTNCPTLIAGHGASVKLGHNIVGPKNTPLCNAWLTLLKGSGVDVDRHGDSTGTISDLVS